MRSSESCVCGIGFGILQGIEGRAEDILEIPARSGGSARIHPNVFHKILEPLPLHPWQIVQEDDGSRVLLAANGGALDTVRISSDIDHWPEDRPALPIRCPAGPVKNF